MNLIFAEADAPSTPIHIVPSEGVTDWAEEQPDRIQAWVEATRFKDAEGQQAFIRKHQRLMCGMHTDGILVFAGTVHPEFQNRPAHGWFIPAERPAVRITAGRQRPDLHGALDLERVKVTIAGASASTPEPR